MRRILLGRVPMQALSPPNTSPVKRPASAGFRQRCASALMHPATLVALAVLLVNDLLLKALWPGAWVPGKLSDLAWMMFAPPVLAFVLSFATLGRLRMQRAAFIGAYAGLPLLYIAFNTFEPVHDVVLQVLGWVGGDGPRSPLDPTDSIVIPVAMAAAIWVWRRQPLEVQRVRIRVALLAAFAAALASVASSFDTDWGIGSVGRTASGTLGAAVAPSWLAADGTFQGYESLDGGLTWTARKMVAPLETQAWQDRDEREVREPSGAYFKVDGPQIIRVYEFSGRREMVYSYEYLLIGGNQWAQALDKRDVENRVIATRALDLFYDDRSGNLIVAMGLQGVVVIAPDGTSTRVAVGRYSPTDFSFSSKARTFFSSLALGETIASTGLAFLLAFSFATFALAAPSASTGPRICFAVAAVISALLAISYGIYPRVYAHPADQADRIIVFTALVISGFGLAPFLVAIGGLAFARPSRRQLLAIASATFGMLLLIAAGALVLFQTGPSVASIFAVVLVGLAVFGPWAYRKRQQSE